jgi:metallophosphoesterase superfamily enzyme
MTPIVESLKRIIVEKKISAIVITGDIAYDLDTNSGINYVNFINYITEIASRTPIIHISGNH